MNSINADKIKVVRIIARLNIGGPAIHAILLSEGLDKNRFETQLVIGRPDRFEGDMSNLARMKKLNLKYIPKLSRKIGFYDIEAFFELLKFINKVKPDIVHTHTAKAGTLGRLAAIVSRVPIRIHTFHGHVFNGYFSPWKARLFILVEKFLSLFTTKTIAVSKGVEEEIVNVLKVVPKEKSVVIGLGLELEKFLKNNTLKGKFRANTGASKDDLLIGIVGRLVPIKNHKMFLEVARKIRNKQPHLKAKFVIIGDGETRESLTDYAKKLNLGNDVCFTGWAEDLPSMYADLDIVVLTSLNEGTPLSLIEAMASAKPIVATDVGGVKDIIQDGENGLLAKANDVETFSEKLISLLQDKEKRLSMGLRGREFAKNTFQKERLVKDVEDLYEECLKINSIKQSGRTR